jgi:putative oxygen-independent coproporphyrinogen III oxidase
LHADLPPLSIYLHWPFCQAICPYCDFNVHLMRGMQPEAWRKAYRAELAYAASQRPTGPVQTVFFGGGTPSLMPPDLVADILAEIDRLWGLAENAEITLEANPVSAPLAQLQAMAQAGVTRLSLGVQSLDDAALKFLGRTHRAADAVAAFDAARTCFAHVSLDLIYARPDQSLADWQAELGQALALQPDHMSLYQLTIEPETPFHRLHQAGRFETPAEDGAADLYEATQEICGQAGLPAYEVSNHARSGHACRHNVGSWQGNDYLGIGPGAHGRVSDSHGRRATQAIRAPQEWLAAVHQQGHGWAEDNRLTAVETQAEAMMLGLRLVEGVSLARLRALGLALDGARQDQLDAMHEAGLIEVTTTHLRTTASGRLVLDQIISALLV